MGIAIRRVVENYKTNEFPTVQQQIEDAAGMPVLVEANWETLATNDNLAAQYPEFFSKVYFQPIIRALKAVAIDDMGKEALKNGLKKIIITDSRKHYSPSGFSFDEGVLTLDHESDSNVDSIDERANAIQKLLETKL